MGKIKFMAEEFFRSFRKNLFKNVLLMAMFSTSMVMTVLMGSYYLDLEERHPEMPVCVRGARRCAGRGHGRL